MTNVCFEPTAFENTAFAIDPYVQPKPRFIVKMPSFHVLTAKEPSSPIMIAKRIDKTFRVRPA